MIYHIELSVALVIFAVVSPIPVLDVTARPAGLGVWLPGIADKPGDAGDWRLYAVDSRGTFCSYSLSLRVLWRGLNIFSVTMNPRDYIFVVFVFVYFERMHVHV